MFTKSETMTFVTNAGDETVAKFRDGDTVLGAATKNKVPLDSSCHEGTCGSCRVMIVESPVDLEPPNDVEAETRAERHFRETERLGCQMRARAGLKVKVPAYD